MGVARRTCTLSLRAATHRPDFRHCVCPDITWRTSSRTPAALPLFLTPRSPWGLDPLRDPVPLLWEKPRDSKDNKSSKVRGDVMGIGLRPRASPSVNATDVGGLGRRRNVPRPRTRPRTLTGGVMSSTARTDTRHRPEVRVRRGTDRVGTDRILGLTIAIASCPTARHTHLTRLTRLEPFSAVVVSSKSTLSL